MKSKEDYIRIKLLSKIEPLLKLSGYWAEELPNVTWNIEYSGFNNYCSIIYDTEFGFILKINKETAPISLCREIDSAIKDNIVDLIPEIIDIAVLHCFANHWKENWYNCPITKKLKIKIL